MKQLSKEELIERMTKMSRDNLMFIFSIIKAVSMTSAVAIFLLLFIDIGDKWDMVKILNQIPKFLLWLVTYCFLLVTYDGATLLSTVLVHIPKKAETFFTFMFVGLETLQFAILRPLPDKEIKMIASAGTTNWWFAIFAIYCLNISAMTYSINSEIKETNYKSDLEDLIKKLKKDLNKVSIGALAIAVLATLLFFMDAFAIVSEVELIIIGSALFLSSIAYAFYKQHEFRYSFDKI